MRRATTVSKMSKLDIEELPDDKLESVRQPNSKAAKMLD